MTIHDDISRPHAGQGWFGVNTSHDQDDRIHGPSANTIVSVRRHLNDLQQICKGSPCTSGSSAPYMNIDAYLSKLAV